jgi:hypothetical protein
MYILNGGRAKGGRSADVGIKLSLLTFHRKAASARKRKRNTKDTSHDPLTQTEPTHAFHVHMHIRLVIADEALGTASLA